MKMKNTLAAARPGVRVFTLALATLLLATSQGISAETWVQSPAATAQKPAREFKEMGDAFVASERLQDAADAYEQALDAGRDQFTLDERVRMAIYISWENRLDRAIDELQRVLKEDPTHIEARTQLARTYSWAGALGKSVAEADEALRRSGTNSDALLVKANALDWGGRFRPAIPLYKQVLERDDNFDARLGLSYALLSGGNRVAAKQTASRLVAVSPRQTDQLGKLNDAIDSVVRPRTDVRYNYYQDTDDNVLRRYSVRQGFVLGNNDFQVQLQRADISKAVQSRSEAASFDFLSNLKEGFQFGGGVGIMRAGLESKSSFPTARMRFDAALSNATVGANISTEVLVDTVELINNEIRTTAYNAYISKPLANRFNTYTTYTYKVFSDGNHSNDIQFAPQFTLTFNPRVAVGYRFRYLDFHKQSGSGFFDPDNYVSHRLFTSFSVERKYLSTYIDIYGGKQNFSRHDYPSSDWVIGGAASVGFNLTRQLTLEVNGEGGNFGAGSIAGYRYFVLGSRISYRF